MSEEEMKDQKVLRLVAEVISGLAAPYSIVSEATRGHPERAFGTAAETWVELRSELNLFGYPPADEVVEVLRRELGIGRLPQRQDSIIDQLRDVAPVAERMGCYDAADFIKRTVAWEDAKKAGIEYRAYAGDDGHLRVGVWHAPWCDQNHGWFPCRPVSEG